MQLIRLEIQKFRLVAERSDLVILILYISHPSALYVYTVHITLSSPFMVRFVYIMRIFTSISRWVIKEESPRIYNTLKVV